MRILLTGINGQVGWELQRALAPLGEVVANDRSRLDLTDGDGIRRVVREVAPTHIVNPAAYTAVDKAETEIKPAMHINGTVPGIFAEEARRIGALLVHYSTDYVFPGAGERPYRENDPVGPLNVYGRSKLAGEQAIQASGCRHLIFRTSWVYGLRGGNFLRTMLRLGAEREELRIVGDQIGAPTWSRMIAETTALALARHRDQQGIYHLSAGGETSWHNFAAEIFAHAHAAGQLAKPPRLDRIASADYPTPATRPKNSRLDGSRLREDFGLVQPDWRDALKMCLANA